MEFRQRIEALQADPAVAGSPAPTPASTSPSTIDAAVSVAAVAVGVTLVGWRRAGWRTSPRNRRADRTACMPSATRLWAWGNRPTVIWQTGEDMMLTFLPPPTQVGTLRLVGTAGVVARGWQGRRRQPIVRHDLQAGGRRYLAVRHSSRTAVMGKLTETLSSPRNARGA